MPKEKVVVATAELPANIEVSEASAITVITNTAESLAGHYPKLVSDIENAAIDKAKPEWMKAERQRLADLNAAFADDPKFANESFVAGISVEQAKAKRHDDLVAKLAEANSKIEKARAEVPFVASDGGTGEGKKEDDRTGDPVSKIEADAKSKWNKDPNIEAEFGTFKTYLAYQRASAAGSFKILQRPEVVK